MAPLFSGWNWKAIQLSFAATPAELDTVLGRAYDHRFVGGIGKVAVNEVEVRSVRNAAQHGVLSVKPHLIPAHMRGP